MAAFSMFTVYVIYSEAFGKIYVGYSSDLESRLRSHNELATKGWTIKFRPWKLIHFESFASKKDALKREKELKSATGRRFI
ncbi:MAG: GIY-YIG nuclease family protein [Cyclobacteriaceae bacterium]|nr:GIY-YIG nuclease family protein [Cyclobacteriaceae bacterium]